MNRLYIVVALFLAGGQALCFCQGESQDPYGEKFITSFVTTRGPVISMHEKAANRLGDGMAVGIIRHVGAHTPTAPEEIDRLLLLIRMAFAAPEVIKSDADREPKATLVLLSYMSSLPASGNAKDAIQQTRTYVEQQINGYKLKHATKNN